ncbi:MAG: polyribonucleotide nucleotidyltransferase [Clostridiales bacterium]|nr:polyribonucleotide nucleotidyltransferase [Clostridiales bacterium]
MDYKSYSMEFAGRTLTLEFGKYAQQAGGSAVVRYGDTVVLVNATASDKPRDGVDFFPLTVDFEEKQYAVGKIPGGFIKREGRPTEKATLTCRLIDRPLRPLFPKGLRNDVQVVAQTLSVDPNTPPEFPAMLGSSIALCISNIPWGGPTAAVVVGRINGQLIINPDEEQSAKSDMHVTVAGTKDAIMMVEAGANEVSEDAMMDAILFAHESIKELVAFQEKITAEIGKEKSEFPLVLTGDDIKEAVREYAYEKCQYVFSTYVRKERQAREAEVSADVAAHFADIFPGREGEVADALYYLNKEVMRRKILDEGIRPDGRKVTEVRPIWCEVGVLPRTHGSAVFTRGETQALTITTLGMVSEAQQLDGLSNEESKRYMHQYNMPSYATGEAGRLRSPNRREIGHGALAERALVPVIPSEAEFPYALRLVSEIMGSNGSSSMASVCGSTLSLMDAGVPIHAPVAGVAMGLIQDAETGKIEVLTDIQGLEDFLGDMDFKVAGTMNGITAIQMDIKIKGINREILSRALNQALKGRLHILGIMLETIGHPRENLSKFAPKIINFTINPDKIREVIGPGGKMINKIIAETGVKIDIEDDGRVFISTPDQAAADKAKAIIMGIAKDIEVGDVFTGKVVRIMNFGAFVELVGGKDGMIHISKLDNKRVEKVEDVVNIGDEIEVKVCEIDSQGRINLIRNDITYENTNFTRPAPAGARPPRRDGRPERK